MTSKLCPSLHPPLMIFSWYMRAEAICVLVYIRTAVFINKGVTGDFVAQKK